MGMFEVPWLKIQAHRLTAFGRLIRKAEHNSNFMR